MSSRIRGTGEVKEMTNSEAVEVLSRVENVWRRGTWQKEFWFEVFEVVDRGGGDSGRGREEWLLARGAIGGIETGRNLLMGGCRLEA